MSRRRRRALPEPAVGQRWALRDDRYEGWRYLTVTALDGERVHARSTGRRKQTSYLRNRFGRGWRWTFCGHDGPGILPPFSRDSAVTLGCATCPPKPTTLPATGYLNWGEMDFLDVTRDGERVFATCSTRIRLAWLEKFWVPKAPTSDWRIRLDSAMSERLYQRQDSGWVLVAIGMGFA